MRHVLRALILCAATAATFAPAAAADRGAAPERRTLIREGQVGRLLLGGTWYFRLDDRREGARRGLARRRSLRGWRPVAVPHNWNGADTVFNRPSHGWYRREIVLPRGPRRGRTAWIARFEGASHHATVYLNGREVGRHSGGYTPFEVDLLGLRGGRNRLVVRLSTLRGPTDLTHWRRVRAGGYGTGGGGTSAGSRARFTCARCARSTSSGSPCCRGRAARAARRESRSGLSSGTPAARRGACG